MTNKIQVAHGETVNCPCCRARQEDPVEDYAVPDLVGVYSELEHCCPVCLTYFNVRRVAVNQYEVTVSRADNTLNIAVCPGCGETLDRDNEGCPYCSYEDNENGRILTLAEMLMKPSYPEKGALVLHDVSPAFLRRLVEEARKSVPQGE